MITGRAIAWAFLATASAALIVLGLVSAISNRVTGHEVLGGLIALLAAAISGLWLRRDRLQRDASRRPQ